jgi:hypothetical protein
MTDVTIELWKKELRDSLFAKSWLVEGGKVFTEQQIEIILETFAPLLKELHRLSA